MNIFHKTAVQSMKNSRTRTVVTVIGVILSAAMITAVSTFVVSLQAYLINGSIQKSGDWHVQFQDVDISFLRQRMNDAEVANAVSFDNIGYAILEGGQNPAKPYLFITGFTDDTFDTLPINLISGRLPENSREVLIPAHVAANGGVRHELGDKLSLVVGSRKDGNEKLGQHDAYRSGNEPELAAEAFIPETEESYTIVGFYARPVFEEYSAPGYTLITMADPANPVDSYSVFVTLAKPRQIRAYVESVAGNHSYIFNNNVLRFMGLSDNIQFNTLLYSFGGILVALIMVGSILLIYNSFAISLSERTRQFGMLSSVGATAKQLRNSVLFEGFCIGIIGIPMGLLVGIGSIWLGISLVGEIFRGINMHSVPLILIVSAPSLLVAAGVSMITILISAYIPARKAASRPVMENIRQSNEVKIESKAVRTSKLARRIYGLEGTLALKNFKRNKKRYRSIVLSLTLSIVLFVSASAFGMYLKQAAEGSVVEVDGDILFSTRDIEESELFMLYEMLKTADGVTASTYQALSTYSCRVAAHDLTSTFWDGYREDLGLDVASEAVELELDIQFIEDGIYQDFIKSLGLPTAEYTGPDTSMIIVGKQSGEIDLFANRSMDFTLNAKSGGEMKTIHTTFVDTYPLDPPPAGQSEVKGYVFMVVAPYSVKPQFDALGAPTKLGLTFWSETPTQSASQMQTMLQDAEITADYSLYNVYQILEQSRSLIFVIDVFAYGFILMISLITVANVFNTISTNIRLRRRELAMLRSVGMADRDFNRMMNFECVFYGIKALLLGLPIAGMICWLIYKALASTGEEIGFALPWDSIAISVFGVFSVVFITMLYAVRRIKRENIIDALRDDMT